MSVTDHTNPTGRTSHTDSTDPFDDTTRGDDRGEAYPVSHVESIDHIELPQGHPMTTLSDSGLISLAAHIRRLEKRIDELAELERTSLRQSKYELVLVAVMTLALVAIGALLGLFL